MAIFTDRVINNPLREPIQRYRSLMITETKDTTE